MNTIKTTNLNLLVHFNTLISERSVSKAAKKAGLSQPAMSHILAKLREIFQDPILVKSPRGLIPTNRANELTHAINQGLEQLNEALVKQSHFNPATSRRTFYIATTDYIGMVLIPSLVKKLSEIAPNVRLELRSWGKSQTADLASESLDMMIGYNRKALVNFNEVTLFTDPYVILMRGDHPKASADSLDLDEYLEMEHMVVDEREGAPGAVNAALKAIGKSRRVGLRVPHFLLSPFVISQTDMVIATAERIAKMFEKTMSIKIFKPPMEIAPNEFKMIWHDKTQHDPAHIWLRELILDVAKSV